jgi:exodeoxyribonuclease-3
VLVPRPLDAPTERGATWNVNGIRARQVQVQAWLESEMPDVVCLQEIKASSDQIPLTLGGMNDYWHYWHGGPRGYSGVSVHVRKQTFAQPPTFSHPAFDFENRIVLARMGALSVASIYVPNGGKDFPAKMRFWHALDEFAASGDGDLVLCGDLNVARADLDVHPKERGPFTGQLPEERALFEQLLARGYVDLGRAFDPANDGLYTWWAPWRNMRARNIGWRLDYILASSRLAQTALGCTVAREVGTSDHAPVIAMFT